MLKSIVPALLIAGAAMSAQAADGDKLLGFEFGVGYHLVDDSRFEGTDINFGLVIPVGQKFDVVIYRENGTYSGKQDALRSTAKADFNELRFRITAWEGENQAVKVFLGLGYGQAQFASPATATNTAAALVGDAGVNVTVLKAKSGPIKGELALNAIYRHFRFTEIAGGAANSGLTDPVNKLGGFVIGANVGLYF